MREIYILRLTGRCNERCVFCAVMGEILEGREIKWEDVRAEIRKAKAAGYQRISFYGGEPTTYPFFLDAVELAGDLGLEISLATNALRFASMDYAESFFQRAKPGSIRVSIYSHRARVHDRITKVPGSLKNTLNGLENMLKHHQRVGASVVVNAWNYTELDPLVDLLSQTGVRGVKFIGLIVTEDVLLRNSDLIVEHDLIREPLNRALLRAREHGMAVLLENLPVCLMESERDSFHEETPPLSRYVKVSACGPCVYAPRCSGLDPNLLRRHGVPRFLAPYSSPGCLRTW